MTQHYQPDHPGTADLMRSHGIRGLLEDAAQAAKGYAESIAPVETGEYRDSFRVEMVEEQIAGERRAVAHLVNDSDHAAVVEDKSHVLSRTKDMIEGSSRG